MEGIKRIGTFFGLLFLMAPAWGSSWTAIPFHEPASHWDITCAPLAPAPLEASMTPLWNQDIQEPISTTLWSYPTEAKFIYYSIPSYHSVWVAEALEKYKIHLLSPFDVPYTLLAKAPLTVRP